ncbi:carboxypeptidase-like regulatory domain-containing protein [Parvicella tangerina]|uniref:Carboxypeptidase regulatory-like domain-containing protein n=1 Tax=Parvicella tangerina TaxID=2829795 RepID=A0A916JMH5_9FLAO|nr:carboxypeptidase-like regulatory domain-containing protein [Parvicella tangerina]CAG5080854.1 hypothetical protein CRYO30217_01462 [Parvicella tangerina]
MMIKTFFLYVILLSPFHFIGQDECRIFGRVLNSNNQPLDYADIVISQDDSVIQSLKTDLDGYFYSENLAAGNYTVSIHSIGYMGSILTDQKVLPHRNLDIGTIQLSPEAVLLKPIIYLYPEEETVVNVKLDYKGDIIYSYPAYPKEGWCVTAHPDGTLLGSNDLEYYGLFWEGIPDQSLTIGEEGFVVSGDQTVSFLENALAELGLNRREAMEFIIFWQPKMENNLYNLIHFSTDEYQDLAHLEVTPQPETIIRVMMVYQPLNHPIDIVPQDLSKMRKERKGFTLVEWGGTKSDRQISANNR